MSTVIVTGNNIDQDYDTVYKAYLNNGATEAPNGFTGVGTTGDGNGFAEGDVITLPNVAKVLNIPFGTDGRTGEGMIVKVTSKTGSVRYQPFYPKSLAKRTNVLQLDKGVVVSNKYDKASGTAANFYQQRAGQEIKSIVNQLIANGQDIVVTKVTPVKTYAFRSTEVIDSNLYQYDFVVNNTGESN